MKIAVVVPPISNLNTLYAAVPRLSAWLRRLGHQVEHVDLSLELFLRMFSPAGLERLFAAVDPALISGDVEDVYDNRDRYVRVIDDVVASLQGRDVTAANRLCRPGYLPDGPNVRAEPPARRAARFGAFGQVELARNLATLAIADLVTLFHQTVAPHYQLLKYGDQLVTSLAGFDELARHLDGPRNPIEAMMLEAAELIAADVDLVCLTCPFPGMLTAALLIGRWVREARPRARTVLGGGYPSTELRALSEPRVFDYVDHVVLDDGEVPLQQLCARLDGAPVELCRTFTREGGRVVYHEGAGCAAPRFGDLPTPDYAGARLDRYVHLLFTDTNAMNRLLNEGTWLKLTAAHGCYWKRCSFCDVHLPYIADFDPMSAVELADQMDAVHRQTGVAAFHFTDEAAPPPLLVNLALELLRRGRAYRFWGNIRFDPGFTPDRCRLLAAAGMIAVTGGLEVASDVVLPRMAKGITIPQVVKVLAALSGADIHTHAYLIYGFPGETAQDTTNSLETLRQLMAARLLRSAAYHRFSLTAHSPVGRSPDRFGIRVKGRPRPAFADYNWPYEVIDGERPSRDVFRKLQAAIGHYGQGQLLDRPALEAAQLERLPAPTVSPTLVADLLALPDPPPKAEPRLCWLGGVPRWSDGLIRVSCADGRMYTARAPRALADDLARCHPTGWGASAPPRRDQLASWDALAPMRARGLVLV